MECHLKKSVSIIIITSMLFTICDTGQAANTLLLLGEKPTKQHVIASQRRGNLVEQPTLIAHYYIVSNNSPAGTLCEGKFTSLAYGDYGQQHLSTPDVQAASPNNLSNEFFGWQQEYRDTNLGLTYLRARYYQSDLKSFMSMDSYSLDNKYAFGYANPVGFIDPSGHMPSALNYAINSIAILTATVAIIPTGGSSIPSDVAIIAGAFGAASGITGIGSQILSDLGVEQEMLSWVSIGLGAMGMLADAIVRLARDRFRPSLV